jgi:hypothetical protein
VRPGRARCRKTSSHGSDSAASTACTEATGSRMSAASRTPSWAASSPNPAASTAGSSAANCQARPTSARCRCAYVIATLVFPTPPNPHNTAVAGAPPSPPVSLVPSSARSLSRPANNGGGSASRTGLRAALPRFSLPAWLAPLPSSTPKTGPTATALCPFPLCGWPRWLALRKAAHVSHNVGSGIVVATRIATAVASR